MDITPLVPQGSQIIQGYAGGAFRISGVLYPHAVAVFPDHTEEWNAPESVADLTPKHFAMLAPETDVILLGTGATHVFPGPEVRKALKEAGLNVEFMATGAACRTYNVLLSEGRRVAVLLMPA